MFTFDRIVKRTKKYIGFHYGNLIRRIDVSFVCENAFGSWGHQMCSLAVFFFFFNTACFILLGEGHVFAFDIVGCWLLRAVVGSVIS
jgi:hypothetical protein